MTAEPTAAPRQAAARPTMPPAAAKPTAPAEQSVTPPVRYTGFIGPVNAGRTTTADELGTMSAAVGVQAAGGELDAFLRSLQAAAQRSKDAVAEALRVAREGVDVTERDRLELLLKKYTADVEAAAKEAEAARREIGKAAVAGRDLEPVKHRVTEAESRQATANQAKEATAEALAIEQRRVKELQAVAVAEVKNKLREAAAADAQRIGDELGREFAERLPALSAARAVLDCLQ